MRFQCLSSLLLVATFSLAQNAPADHLLGFTAEHAQSELRYEKQFKAAISPIPKSVFHREFTRTPHPAGTNTIMKSRTTSRKMEEQGLEDVVIRQYDVLGTRPSFDHAGDGRRSITRRDFAKSRMTWIPTRKIRKWRMRGWAFLRAAKSPRRWYTRTAAIRKITRFCAARHRCEGQIVLVRYSNPYSYRGFKALTARKHGSGGAADVFRSGGGRIRERQSVSGWTVGAGDAYPAGRNHLRFYGAGRSVDARMG